MALTLVRASICPVGERLAALANVPCAEPIAIV